MIISKIKTLIFTSILFTMNFFTAQAADEISVENAYIRAIIPGASNTAAYMELVNKSSSSIALVKVTSDISDRIEIHQHTMSDGKMRMEKVNELEVPADSAVIFQPHGYHLMIFNADNTLNSHEHVNLTLHFHGKAPLTITYQVKALNKSAHPHKH